MNPAGYLGGTVPLQMVRYDVPPVVHTSVNVSVEPPRDHIVWSLCSFVYLNPFCFGLAALVYSVKARDRKLAGDLNAAQRLGSSALFYNILSLGSVVISVIILLIFFLTCMQ